MQRSVLTETEKLRKIKRLSIGKNVTEIGFWQYDQLERLTIPESLNDSIETFIDHSPELVSIIVKGNEKDLDAHGNDHDNDGERAGCRLTENGTAAGSGG